MAELALRRRIVAALTIGTYLALAAVMASVLGAGGWTLLDIVMMVCFLVAAPWSVLGVWNALIGLWLLHAGGGGMRAVAPFADGIDDRLAVRVRTAVLMTIRNEDPERAVARLRVVKDSLDATGQGAHFAYFLLSDTTDPATAAAEERAFAAWRVSAGPGAERLHYRRREHNTGFKAGNLRDFCARWGRDYELMLPLDADSLMSGGTILAMVRMMQAHPRLGILQSLVVGMPSTSAFARLFQFGMRQGMRPYTMGSAWWAGDCGPFWGHNGLVRIRPFMEQCDLPLLPGKPPLGGPILSHDQVEAALMRKAGYEVRVLPFECESFEENPPTALEFMRRDLRWCQGNMQYWRLLGLPGLLPMSRFQLAWAIAMFVGVPAWTLLIACAALKPLEADAAVFPVGPAIALYLAFLGMYLAPKLAGFLDVAITPGGLARYGGGLRFSAGAVAEVVSSFLIGAVVTFRVAIFMIGLAFSRSVHWGGQARDAHAVSWGEAWRALWPQTLYGALVVGVMLASAPALLAWASPLVAGYLLAVPFTVLTSRPSLGAAMARIGLCAVPEEFAPPPEFAALATGDMITPRPRQAA
jgi:membrane glycosyltransferase